MQYLPEIMIALVAFLIGGLSPGPNILAIMTTSMSAGRSAGKSLALGVASGSFLWGGLSLVGLTALLSTYAPILTAIKIFGAGYLLWLAYKAFRAAASIIDPVARKIAAEPNLSGYYRQGLTIQMSNPKAVLTWAAVMSITLGEGVPLWVPAVVVLGSGVTSVVVHITWAVAFSTPPLVAVYQKTRRGIQATLGAFFCFASYKLLTSRLQNLE